MIVVERWPSILATVAMVWLWRWLRLHEKQIDDLKHEQAAAGVTVGGDLHITQNFRYADDGHYVANIEGNGRIVSPLEMEWVPPSSSSGTCFPGWHERCLNSWGHPLHL